MKKIVFLIMALFLLSVVGATQTVITSAEDFRIDLVRYDPSPVQPGESSNVHFEITNLGDEDLTDFEILLVDTFPFFLDESADNIIIIDEFLAGETKEFIFPIDVNANVEDGFYSLGVEVFSEKINKYVTESFTVYVQRVNRVVSATSVSLESSGVEGIPGQLAPGEIGQLSIDVKNSADYRMKDISVKLVLNETSVFAPIGSTAFKSITTIASGDSEEVVFDIIVLPDAEANVYTIPLEIKYYDSLGNFYTRDDLIGVIVGGEPDFHIEIRDNDLGNTGEVTLNIVNTGLAKVKFLKVRLEESDDYKITSEDYLYLGDVDPDDDESVDFFLDVNTMDGEVTLPITLTFRDANNYEYEQSYSVDVSVTKQSNNGNYVGLVVFLVIVAAVLFVIFRKKIIGMFKKK